MHQLTNKKKIVIFLIFLLVLLSSLNNKNLTKYNSDLFKIKSIKINGLDNEKYEKKIVNALNYLNNENLIFLDKDKLTKILNNFNFLNNFSVFKNYPKRIIVNLEQASLVAIYYNNGNQYYIGSNGKILNSEDVSNGSFNLPKVYGKFKTSELINLMNLLNKNHIKFNSIETIFYFESKRWDLQLKNNILIRLPNIDIDIAIELAKKIIEDDQFNEKIIDLRVANQVIINNE
ncbi:MAG: hypothetical protein CBE49_004065 [Rickettsiales bacterium TMED289]|nr:MAG: hypothetical protein CBE49_004065 [Rickettsiales bacterium TMED289]|tara:strand:+ start:1839 stop:2534 length:696 start_codon:yes stop_codon:yes gene_type:complete